MSSDALMKPEDVGRSKEQKKLRFNQDNQGKLRTTVTKIYNEWRAPDSQPTDDAVRGEALCKAVGDGPHIY
jgi:hypothetical protein